MNGWTWKLERRRSVRPSESARMHVMKALEQARITEEAKREAAAAAAQSATANARVAFA